MRPYGVHNPQRSFLVGLSVENLTSRLKGGLVILVPNPHDGDSFRAPC